MDNNRDKNGSFLLYALVLFVLFVVVCYGWLVMNHFSVLVSSDTLEVMTPGTFGDSFGVINTLFAGLAFAGLFYTIYQQGQQIALQRNELSLQRKELELTREELSRSASAQEKSEKALADQVDVASAAAMLNAANYMQLGFERKKDELEKTRKNIPHGDKQRFMSIHREVLVINGKYNELDDDIRMLYLFLKSKSFVFDDKKSIE